MPENPSSMPIPDPTVLTTAQLIREIGAVRELVSARMDAMDAVTNVQRELTKVKFDSIALQFLERDVRAEQLSKASADALAAALQAAKELVGAAAESAAAAAVKSETSFTKQLDQIGTIINTLEKAVDARINELKERMDRGEGIGKGTQQQIVDSRAGIGTILGIAGFVFGLVGAIIAVSAAFR